MSTGVALADEFARVCYTTLLDLAPFDKAVRLYGLIGFTKDA